VSNPTFEAEQTATVPTGWSVWGPEWENAACRVRASAGGGFVVDGADPYAVGGLVQDINQITGGQAYAVKSVCLLRDFPAPYYSLLVRVSWMRSGKLLHPAGMLVRGPIVENGVAKFDDVLVAPEDADSARLSLGLKWPRGGLVLWKNVSMQPAPAPEPRKVKVGTVFLRPRNSTGFSAAEKQHAGKESEALVRTNRCRRQARTRYCMLRRGGSGGRHFSNLKRSCPADTGAGQ